MGTVTHDNYATLSIMTEYGSPAAANTAPNHEFDGPFRVLEIGPEGVQLIDEALRSTNGLEGKALDDALMNYFAEIASRGELKGVDDIAEWAHGDVYQNEMATVIKPLTPDVEFISDEARYRYAVAQTAMISHVLGTPWSRHYENGGQRIQHVKPAPGHEAVEGSIGAVQLYPHNEVLPTRDGKIICSQFSTLYAVHNTHSGTATTLYDAQAAINQLTPREVAVLSDPNRFKWNGTDIEREDAEEGGGEVAHTLLPVLTPVYGEDGRPQTYDLIADLDGKTMGAVDGDDEAAAALVKFRDLVTAQEAEYVIKDGHMFIWRNRKALHGRRPVTDMSRHLVRSQVGEAEFSEYPPVAA